MDEILWANVFVGPDAGGNATGVVVERAPLPPGRRWRIARALRAPDTVFLRPGDGGATARFYSPYEGEMAQCGQGLLAADAALRHLGLCEPDADLWLETTVGRHRTWRNPSDRRFWVEVAGDGVRALGEAAPASSFLPGLRGRARVVDSGRRRVFVETEALESTTISPAKVLGVCQANDLSGLCLFHRTAPDRVRLRVFTVSLAGGEDASTGGAALGLAAVLRPACHELVIDQGSGHALRRGRLFLRPETDSGGIAVGGDVELIASGRLLPSAS